MTKVSAFSIAWLLAVAVIAAIAGLLSPSLTYADSSGAFTGLSGLWRGAGELTRSNGKVEPVRCEASYKDSASGDQLVQTLDCAGAADKFKLWTSLETNGAEIVGEWRELTRQVQGGVSGRVSGPIITVAVRGQNLSAHVTVTTHGAAQAIEIEAPGGDLAHASITLHRVR